MSTYHAAAPDLRAWVEGRAAPLVAVSVEAHLVRCAACRTAVAGTYADVGGGCRVDAHEQALPDLDATWGLVRDRVEAPKPVWAERVLVRLGMDADDAGLVVAAPSLRGSWVTALTLALVFALAAGAPASGAAGVTLFLLVAPLVPVFTVALAYGPEASAALEQEASTPYPVTRLILLRTVAVLAVCLPVAAGAGLLLPGRLPYLWLLPAAAFTASVLGLSTWMTPLRAALVVTVAWAVVVGASAHHDSAVTVLDGPHLAAYALLFLAGPTILVCRFRQRGTLGRIT